MAFRLTFESDGDVVRLVRKRRVEMLAPEMPGPGEQTAGVYAELRNEHEETLYEVDLSPQFEPTVEVFSPDGGVARMDAPDQKRLVVVVVPEPAGASALVVVRRGATGKPRPSRVRGDNTDAGPDDEDAAAQEELARVSLFSEEPG